MNFHQLKIFYTVAQQRSFTTAAFELRLTQPAVSQQIKALEKELGLALFERGAAKLRLTQAGEAFFRTTVTILNAKDEGERIIAELGAATKGKLILGANTTGGMYLLPRIVRVFKEKYPQAEITFQIESTEWLYERILENVIDLALVGGPTDDRRFGVEPVCRDRLAFIASPSHRLSKVSRASLKDIAAEPFIVPAQGSRTRQLVERGLKSAGVTPKVVMQLIGTEAVKRAVAANLGVGFVSQYAVEREGAPAELKVVSTANFALERDMELIYKKQKYFSPIADRFRNFVHEYAAVHLAPPGSARRPTLKLV